MTLGKPAATQHAIGFGQRVGWGERPALLLIDMMHAYFDPESPFCLPSRSAVDGCTALLAAARSSGVPVLHTRVEYGPDGAGGGLFVRKVPALALLESGGAAGRFEPGLEPEPGEVVVIKQYASAFFGTSLSSTLNAARIDTLVMGGVSTSGCVRASATDALQLGFRPIVVQDACGDRDQAVHQANLFDLDAKYADVIRLDDALSHFG